MIKPKINKYLCVILMIALYLFLLVKFFQNSDMYFTIASGRDLLNGNFETISLVNNHPAIIQQWLYAVIITIFDNYGIIGDITVVFIQDILLWLVSYIYLYRQTKNKYLSSICPIFFICILSSYLCSIRPEIITVLLVMTQILVLDIYQEKQNKYILLWLIPILILEANLHQALFLYHIYALIPFYIYNKKIDWYVVLSTPICLLCSLCTPYGIDGSLFMYRVFKTHVFSHVSIEETNGLVLNFGNTSTISICISVFIVFILLLYLSYNKNIDIKTFYFSIASIICSFISFRHIILLYFSYICLTCIVIQYDVIKSFFAEMLTYINLTLALVVILMSLQFKSIQDFYSYDSDSMCPQIVSYLEENNIDKNAKIFNAINLGGYLEYYGYNVAIDSRPELYTKELSKLDYDLLYKHLKVEYFSLTDIDSMEDYLNDYDYIIINNEKHIDKFLIMNDNFVKIYDDDNGHSIWRPINTI